MCFLKGVIRGISTFIHPSLVAESEKILNKIYSRVDEEIQVRVVQAINRSKFWIYLTLLWNLIFYNVNIYFLIYFFLTGQRFIAVSAYFPYTNIDDNLGFLLNTFLHSCFGFIGFSSFCSYEMLMILKCTQGANIQLIIEAKLEHLSEELNKHEFSKLIMIEEIKERQHRSLLIEIIDLYEDYKAYMDKMITYLMPSCIAVVFLNVFALCTSILLIFSTDVKFKILVSLLMTSGMFIMCIIPCAVGNFLNVHNDKFLTNVCAIPWYKLSQKNQKIFMQFIMICQDPPEFVAPVIGNFSFSLITDIISSTYTYFMYLRYFVDKN